MLLIDQRIVESFKHIEATNTIEVIFREPSNMVLTCNPPRPAPDRVWKEIYGVVDGKIKLIDTKTGTHHPAKTISESITFE